MKKFLAIALSAIFVLGIAATAFAIHAEIPAETQAVVAKGATQVTLGGSVRVRGDYRKNMDFNDDDITGNSAIYDQRTRLSTAVTVSDQVQGLVTLEAASGPDNDVYTWGEPGSGASGVYQVGNAKRGDLNLLEAWIVYQAEMVGLKVGHMPLALGNKLFFDHTKFGDDAIVLFKDIDNLHIAALTAKFDEGENLGGFLAKERADDADAYVVLAAYKGANFNASGDITLVDDDVTFGLEGADLYNVGLRGDIGIGSIKVYGDVEFQTGSIENAAPGGGDLDFGGLAVQLGVSAKLSGIGLGLELGMGSGDDDPLDDSNDLFITSLSPGIPYITYVHGTRTGAFNAGGGNGISNITYVKASVNASLMANLSGKLALVMLQATEDFEPTGGDGVVDDDIGMEIDANLKYNLAKNLVYFVEAGYFMPGDAYKLAGPTGPMDPDDAYAIRHGLELSF